jgi:SAM-dependent methyltransferase
VQGKDTVEASADYRSSHADPEKPEEYELAYRPGTYAAWVWEREKPYLDEVIDRRLPGARVRYLDLACGTGRIIGHVEHRVAESTGVDISGPMLEIAARNVTRSTLVHGDPTRDGDLVTGPFQLVTSFRLLLNAQPELREDVLAFTSRILADEGIFVFDVHGNTTSLRVFGPLRNRLFRREPIHQLAVPQVRRLLRRYGLEVVEMRGFGLLTPKLFRTLGRGRAERIEALAQRFGVLQYLCVNLVFVARKRRRG